MSSENVVINNENIRDAINMWIDNNDNAIIIYGNIENWDTSNVTDMSHLFENKTEFNENISKWNTSNVVNFTSMFEGATSMNSNVTLNCSSVTNMSSMFEGATSMNGIVSFNDSSNLTNITNMINSNRFTTANI